MGRSIGSGVSIRGKSYQDVSLQKQARLNSDADTRAAVSLHIAVIKTVITCSNPIPGSALPSNSNTQPTKIAYYIPDV